METTSLHNQTLFARSEHKVLTGVAGGMGEFLGINPWVVRIGLVLMTLGSGFGLAVYAVGYLVSGRPEELSVRHEPTRRHAIGFLMISFGVLLYGSAFLADNVGRIASLRAVWLAVIITVAVLILLVGPWLLRLVSKVSEERRDRIRSEERADLSAHLHDSVLNTLALIQRSEAKPEVVMLARRQERELRAWMQGRLVDESVQLDAAIDALATRVEAQYNVSVDVVVVGGAVHMDERMAALVASTQEAVINAARHAGVDTVSVYVEVSDTQLIGFVRDQGTGFDRNAVDDDRRGIANSIEGRMRRVGGKAIIRTAPGEGTEVELQVPRAER